MALPVINDVTNEGDGRNVLVTLDAAPAGALTFYVANKIAGPFAPSVLVTQVDTLQWAVQITNIVMSTRMAWWVYAHDAGQPSGQRDSIPRAAWLAFGSVQDELTLCEVAIHDILSDSKDALDTAYQIRMGVKTYREGSPVEVARIVRGLPYQGHDAFPIVSIRVNKFRQDVNFAAGSSDYCPVSGTIYVYEFHQGKTPREHIVQAVGMGILDFLNLNIYRNLPLANGHTLQEQIVIEGETNEIEDTDIGAWYAVAELTWQGKITRGRPA